MAILEVKNLKKIYTTRFGGNQVQALSNVTFSVEDGEYVAIMGESGSGKTTLLNILASLDKPTSGEVLLNGRNITQISEKEISAFRRDNLGFVFQDFNLLDTFSLKDNIFLPLVLAGQNAGEMEAAMIRQMLRLFNLSNVGLFIECSALTFAAFAAIYALVYYVTAREYYKIVQYE